MIIWSLKCIKLTCISPYFYSSSLCFLFQFLVNVDHIEVTVSTAQLIKSKVINERDKEWLLNRIDGQKLSGCTSPLKKDHLVGIQNNTPKALFIDMGSLAVLSHA